MYTGTLDRSLIVLSIILTLASLIHSGCYQKKLCCLGSNFTCFATENDHLLAKFHQQRLKKGQKGKWYLPVYNRRMKRKGKLTLRDMIPLDSTVKVAAVTNDGYGLSNDYLRNQEIQPKTIEMSSNTAISRFIPYEVTFGQPFYSTEQQQPDITHYYQRHKFIRYSLLNRHIPMKFKNSRGIEWSNDGKKLKFLGDIDYENLCYCDEKCMTHDDCCSDYSLTCPPSDCVVSEWSTWSQCILDQGSCENGIQTRKRTIVQKAKHGGMECPSLVEKMSCFRECLQPRRRHQSEIIPVALILDYSYNRTRERFSRRNIHKRLINKNSSFLYYCGIYQFGWVNPNCIDKKFRIKLYTGNQICIECQPEAQLHISSHICTSDLNDEETGFWKLIGPKSCNGMWKKLSRTDSCRCEINFPKHDAFLFV